MTRRLMLVQGAALAMLRGGTDAVVELIEKQTSSGQVTAVTLLVRQGGSTQRHAFGSARTADAVFLLASLTKPMTATALMVLADRKEIALTDPVQRFVPEFRGNCKKEVRIKHLLTHTSGLPDMLPEDQELRKRHAPLSEFVAGTCKTPLLFRPGSELRYQSMGILLAGEIVYRVSKTALPEFAKEHVFSKLGMESTSIGLGGREISQTMPCQVAPATDWDWNSVYWRNLASPWGGAFGTVNDIELFLRYFAQPDERVLKPKTARAMISDQTEGLQRSWGLGWMRNNGQFGKGCSAATYGHSGSTGTLCWLDPKRDLSMVLLTTRPAAESNATLLNPVSNGVSNTR